MTTSIKSIRTKWKAPEKRATARLIIGAVFLIGFIAPYSHIYFNSHDTDGLFGFKTMAGTLYAIGFPVFTITLSALLMYAASFMPRELQKAYNLFAVLTSFTGFYFLIWCINPYVEKDFNPVFYYGAMILISSALTHATVYIEQYFNRLTSIVHYLLRVIYSADKDGYIKESKQGEYDKVKVEAVDYVVENER